MTEKWVPIRGYEGAYEVSSHGNIRALARDVANRWGGKRPLNGGLKAPNASPTGYLAVHLYRGSRFDRRYIHRLVAEHFLPPCEGKVQVNHKDGDKTNNRSDNLEWVTGSENCRHAIDNALYQQARGETHARAKITEADVLSIRAMVASGMMQKDVAPLFNIGKGAVGKIVNRQRWAHVP